MIMIIGLKPFSFVTIISAFVRARDSDTSRAELHLRIPRAMEPRQHGGQSEQGIKGIHRDEGLNARVLPFLVYLLLKTPESYPNQFRSYLTALDQRCCCFSLTKVWVSCGT
jgi:hypothetical protein